MAQKAASPNSGSRLTIVNVSVILGLVLFMSFANLWWKRVYTTPRNVFWGMIHNNLATSSVTRQTTTEGEGQTVNQFSQVSFVSEPVSKGLVVIKQGTDSAVKTETVGTRNNDYNRYVSIHTTQKNQQGQPLNFDSVLGLWGKSADGSGQYLAQSGLGLIPFANLPASLSQPLFQELETNKAYDIDYSKVESVKVNGRAAWQYPVKVHVAAYVGVLNKLAKDIGLQTADSLDPKQYKDSPPIELTITVDKLSRHLVKLKNSASSQEEIYSSYGLSAPVDVPKKTISIDELQTKVQAIQ